MNRDMIDKDYIQKCIQEFSSIIETSDNRRKVSLLETALFIEDMFDIQVRDDEICPENLENAGDLINFVKKKRGMI